MGIEIKRIYEPAAEGDGRRVLVDRLWPRGVSKQEARLDEWLKDVAPSPALRAWFGHMEENFDEFSKMYRLELDTDPVKQAAVRHLLEAGQAGKVTLLYGARSATVNHAAVLRGYLRERME
jgi:uncharacterized protein YeaO (DUF488 family)